MDMTGSTDMKTVTPYNMPGKVDCYGTPCTVASANPVCCDAPVDGGDFSDTCVASAQACLAMSSSAKTFACGQAADCTAGQICCGNIGMSSSGKSYFVSTMCAPSCPSGNTQLCVTANECKSGTQCTGAYISGRDVGLCQ